MRRTDIRIPPFAFPKGTGHPALLSEKQNLQIRSKAENPGAENYSKRSVARATASSNFQARPTRAPSWVQKEQKSAATIVMA